MDHRRRQLRSEKPRARSPVAALSRIGSNDARLPPRRGAVRTATDPVRERRAPSYSPATRLPTPASGPLHCCSACLASPCSRRHSGRPRCAQPASVRRARACNRRPGGESRCTPPAQQSSAQPCDSSTVLPNRLDRAPYPSAAWPQQTERHARGRPVPTRWRWVPGTGRRAPAAGPALPSELGRLPRHQASGIKLGTVLRLQPAANAPGWYGARQPHASSGTRSLARALWLRCRSRLSMGRACPPSQTALLGRPRSGAVHSHDRKHVQHPWAPAGRARTGSCTALNAWHATSDRSSTPRADPTRSRARQRPGPAAGPGWSTVEP